MKHPRRLLSAFLAAALLAVTVPLSAEAEAASKESSLAIYTDETTINPDYFDLRHRHRICPTWLTAMLRWLRRCRQ